MKIALFLSTLLTLFMLQACTTGQATKAEWDSYDHWKRSSKQKTAPNKANKQVNPSTLQARSANNTTLSMPETQLIRELSDAGCIIEDFTLDRRKQNIHISCAKGAAEGNSNLIRYD